MRTLAFIFVFASVTSAVWLVLAVLAWNSWGMVLSGFLWALFTALAGSCYPLGARRPEDDGL